ncbi:hypothetical protein H7691_15370 [Stenotrophomonas sp. CW117]|jgi:hypothetical protein|uniref:hypothetical protein n=1 Tax=Stenotrophomonas TaxID=40323 RepID=UPI00128EA7FC|nr:MULTISPECIES: hypothetical protein [Stenotrophomonas]QOF97987.1 hypothetical protein H7691_15370 [Stenotrophomonas sp. CW117]
MDYDLYQIKLLLWAILGLQLLFVLINIACRIFSCSHDSSPNYRDLLDRGEFEKILAHTKKRLASHPDDLDALYFHAKALQSSGLPLSARPFIERLGKNHPLLARAAQEWIAAIDESDKGYS